MEQTSKWKDPLPAKNYPKQSLQDNQKSTNTTRVTKVEKSCSKNCTRPETRYLETESSCQNNDCFAAGKDWNTLNNYVIQTLLVPTLGQLEKYGD